MKRAKKRKLEIVIAMQILIAHQNKRPTGQDKADSTKQGERL